MCCARLALPGPASPPRPQCAVAVVTDTRFPTTNAAVANTDYGLGITLETCEDPSWLDLSDPANPVYVGTNPHYLSGVLNIVGVIMLLLAQILINTRLVVYMSIYWYATDKRVANLVFLDDFVRVPDKEVVGSSSEVTLL